MIPFWWRFLAAIPQDCNQAQADAPHGEPGVACHNRQGLTLRPAALANLACRASNVRKSVAPSVRARPTSQGRASTAIRIEDGGPVSALAAALKDSDPEVRVLTAWALGEIEDDRAVEPLVGALKDSDEDVRATAAWALGEIESPRAVDGLTAAQRDEVGSVRHAATWALRQIDDNDDNHDVRVRVRPRVRVKP